MRRLPAARSIPWLAPALAGIILGTLSACGGQSYDNIQTSGAPPGAVVPSAIPGSVPGSVPGSTTGTTGGFPFGGSTGSSSSTTGGFPPYSYNFSVTGPGGTDPTYTAQVNTDNILRIDIAAGPGGELSLGSGQYSNYTANYGCVSYKLTVMGQTVVTQILSTSNGQYNYDYICPGAPNTQTIDFSGRLTPGHNAVMLEVQANGYDYYCQLCNSPYYFYLFNGCGNYCPLYGVYRNHTVTGTLTVHVNGST